MPSDFSQILCFIGLRMLGYKNYITFIFHPKYIYHWTSTKSKLKTNRVKNYYNQPNIWILLISIFSSLNNVILYYIFIIILHNVRPRKHISKNWRWKIYSEDWLRTIVRILGRGEWAGWQLNKKKIRHLWH